MNKHKKTQTETGEKTQSVTIFGPNLRDQSKGQFIVHDYNCNDCGKLRHEISQNVMDAKSMQSIAESWYLDQINEGSCSMDDAINNMHFAPCVKLSRNDCSDEREGKR
jgi:hypothetical protein